MRKELYNREKAVQYAEKWAFGRNKRYYNFDGIGGDCTNFVSQCIYAGAPVMNYTANTGWYYISINERSPSWSGVEFLHEFLTNNTGAGPHGVQVECEQTQIGDIVQLSFDGIKFSHTMIIVNIDGKTTVDSIYTASHTYDSYNRKLSSYSFKAVRFIHINGVYHW